ncbi:MAG: formimidoylglutamate deiminase [Ilumatobacteraceae bacterium]
MAVEQVWCERALVSGNVERRVLLGFDGGRIVSIEMDVGAPADVLQLVGLTLPGFANAHSHAFHRALRGRTHAGPGDFWTWREQMYAIAARLTPDNYLALARAVFAEMVLAGYTVVGEFHYVHHAPDGSPYDDPNAMGQVLVQAARDAGIRITLLDACYLRGGSGVALNDEQQRFGDGTATLWAERVAAIHGDFIDHVMVRVGAAIHSVRAVDAMSIATVAAFAAAREMPLHAHVSEQLVENEQAALEYNCTPTQILARQGALSQRFTAVHATHLTDADIGLYATAGSTCCFCPTTERDLADGIGPSTELATAGVALSVGSDQHAVTDPFEEIRAIETNERLRSMRRGNHSATSLLTAGAANGYACLGWPSGGVIVVGALADLTTVSLESTRVAGAPVDALADAVVFAATAADVTDVFVGGRHLVSGGRHLTIDVAAELAASIAAVIGCNVEAIT